MLAARDEDSFVDRLLAGLGSFPAYFSRLPEVNRRGPRLYGTLPALDRIGVTRFRDLIAQGSVLVDVRPIEDFAAGHIPGALSIELRPVFASWLGWLVEPDRPLIFVLGDDQDRSDLVRQCLTVGYEHLVGELDGGMTAWRVPELPESTITIVGPEAIGAKVVDVRQRNEYVAGHVPGALHIELGRVGDAVNDVPNGPVTVMCGHGERAMTAASLLVAHGRADVSVLAGGPDDWATATGRALA
jgi:rhodanese-related sulfurtransferase